MKRTANRRGNVFGSPDVAPKTGSDSSHGSAIATPAPRRTARLEMFMRTPSSPVHHENTKARNHEKSLARTFRGSRPLRRQELHADRRRRVGEHARWHPPTVAGIDE